MYSFCDLIWIAEKLVLLYILVLVKQYTSTIFMEYEGPNKAIYHISIFLISISNVRKLNDIIHIWWQTLNLALFHSYILPFLESVQRRIGVLYICKILRAAEGLFLCSLVRPAERSVQCMVMSIHLDHNSKGIFPIRGSFYTQVKPGTERDLVSFYN